MSTEEKETYTEEELIIIEEYEFSSDKRSEKIESHFKAVTQALQLMINDNLEYLRYAQAKHWLKFMNSEEEKRTATHNAIVHIANRITKWEPYDAQLYAFEILQDVNLHEQAASVAELLDLNLKPYEVE